MGEISPESPAHGGCLCGSVKVSVKAEPVFSANCHCLDCRKFFGAGHNSFALFPDEAVDVAGELSSYTVTADSGEEITRNFCPTCGGPVYGHTTGAPGMTILPLAVIDGEADYGIRPKVSVFTKSAAAWDPPMEGIPAFAEGLPSRR